MRTDIQEKVEVTSENETASNHSTGYVAGVQRTRNNKNIEKGSDTQVRIDLLMVNQMLDFTFFLLLPMFGSDFGMIKITLIIYFLVILSMTKDSKITPNHDFYLVKQNAIWVLN